MKINILNQVDAIPLKDVCDDGIKIVCYVTIALSWLFGLIIAL